MIAAKSNCPVLPICIKTKGMRFKLFQRTEIIFGAPIPPETISKLVSEGKSYSEISDFIFEKICVLGQFSHVPIPQETNHD